MMYNFDVQIDRKGTNTFKWDNMQRLFGRNDLLPFWVADMDFLSPPEIGEAVRERTDHGVFGYTFIPDSAYQAVTQWCGRRYDWEISREWIAMGNGVMSSVAFAIQAFTGPGDGIIVHTPVYYPFFNAVELNNRKLLVNPLLRDETGSYRINFAEMEAHMKAGARMLLLCSPHNPVGRVWTEDELNEIGRLCVRYDVLIISDEIHADLIMPGFRHISLGSLRKEYSRRVIVCMAPSKTFNIPGMAVSQVIIPSEDIRNTYNRYIRRHFLEIKNLFGIIALEAAYSKGEKWLDELLDYVWGNYRFSRDFLMKHMPDVQVTPLEGTYLMWMDFRSIDPEGCGKQLVEKGKVGLSDGAVFGETGAGFQRMNLACPRSRLEEGLRRIVSALSDV